MERQWERTAVESSHGDAVEVRGRRLDRSTGLGVKGEAGGSGRTTVGKAVEGQGKAKERPRKGSDRAVERAAGRGQGRAAYQVVMQLCCFSSMLYSASIMAGVTYAPQEMISAQVPPGAPT